MIPEDIAADLIASGVCDRETVEWVNTHVEFIDGTE